MSNVKNQIMRVAVTDYRGKLLTEAKITIIPQEGRRRRKIDLKYDKNRRVYVGKNLRPGKYLLRAEAQGLATQERIFRVKADTIGKERFVLGKKDMPFYYRGRVQVPFKPKPELLGVSVRSDLSKDDEGKFQAQIKKLRLTPEKIDTAVLGENIRVFKLPARTDKRARKRAQQRLSEMEAVRLVGPIVCYDKNNIRFLTTELIVRFKIDVSLEEIQKIANQLKMSIIRNIPYVPNGYLLRAEGLANLEILSICEELVKSGMVEYAEPNMVTAAIDFQINPTDFLFGQQWSKTLINLPDAWQILRNMSPAGVNQGDPGDLTFGSEDIIIAIMDRGIQSQTTGGVTTARNPDFNVNVTNGDYKVYQFYDFLNMSTDNDNPPNRHGICCAGVAAAAANNPSIIAGEEEGCAGAAPNCKVMGLIRPAGGTDQQYADAYIWTAGFDPGWVVDGVNYFAGTTFPAIINPGADIISNSFQIPDGNLMEDCLDFLTTYGRGGRGIPFFAAAGNTNAHISNAANNSFAAYERIIAVTSSSVLADGTTEIKVTGTNFDDSAFGDENEIDVCAPSRGNFFGITTCTLIGEGNTAGHTGGGNDYSDDFGGTSSACPLTAGVAALMLSANPDLSWVQVRQILRDTAVHIDATNTNLIGQWVDLDGDGNDDFSQWYGFGRINAEDAVQEAADLVGIDPLTGIDTWIMENSADVGDVPSPPPYSPDVWVRNLDPATDNPAQVNVHQSPIRGQDNWVYANIRNRGAVDSNDVYARLYITRWAGTQYVYPEDFTPTVPPSTYPVVQMAPGTYLIDEVHIDSVPANGVVTINARWPSDLIPPASVTIDGVTYSWADSCLLVEVSPHDGPVPTGVNTWDNNNLCQRNITIVDADDMDGFALAFVVGNRMNTADYLNLRIDRVNLPAGVNLHFDYIDQGLAKEHAGLLKELKDGPRRLETCDIVIGADVEGTLHCGNMGETSIVTLPSKTRFTFPCCRTTKKNIHYRLTPVTLEKRTVFALPTTQKAYVPVMRKRGECQPTALVISGLRNLKKGRYKIDIFQESPAGTVEGGINLIIRK